MNITDLLLPCPNSTPVSTSTPPAASAAPTAPTATAIHDDDLMSVWEQLLCQSGFRLKATCERNTLTDAILSPLNDTDTTLSVNDQQFIKDTPIHIKVIGRHMNGSFRCHIGTGKASRPIESQELGQQMRLLAVFFRAANRKSQWVSPDFIFFPTWLFHLFRYTQYDTSPGRTDVRFLEDAALAKEDHIYRLNHVLNSLFRFSLHNFNVRQLWDAVALANFLFDQVGLDCFGGGTSFNHNHIITPPALYSPLIAYLHALRPLKSKPMCSNCNTKTASRRKLCVACYRYHLKHGEQRPLRLIVTNQTSPGHDHHHQQQQPLEDARRYDNNYNNRKTILPLGRASTASMIKPYLKSSCKKYCANCGVHETHQWYRNLCGQGHWCETCKSYYLRHNKVRPPELFVKAAKRKVDVRSLVSWATWAWDHQQQQQQQQQHQDIGSSSSSSSSSDPPHYWQSTTTSFSPMATPVHHHYYGNNNSNNNNNNNDSGIMEPTPWAPSGCRPHLYHPRNASTSSSSSNSNSNSGSQCNSPSSVSLPSTPPSSGLPSPSAMLNDKHAMTSLPSLPLAFASSGQDYASPHLFDCL